MKKAYVAPTVEKVEFQYDKVVAASGTQCKWQQGKADNYQGCTDHDYGSGSWVTPAI